MEEVVVNSQIKIVEEWLIFNDHSSLKLSELSDMEVHYDPKVKIVLPFFLWLFVLWGIFFIDGHIDTSSYWWFDLFALFYLIGGVCFFYSRVKHNFHCYSGLIVTSRSGKSYCIYSDNLEDLNKLQQILREARKRKDNNYHFYISNKGIVNIGNNNQNEIKNEF